MTQEVLRGDKMSVIGANIRASRRLNGMTQKYLAAKLGISVQGLNKIEMGKVSPRVETVEKVIDVLCITPNQLFGVEQITEENGSLVERLRKLNV